MVLHVSFTVNDTARVASVLAQLLGASVVDCPSPPFPEGSKYVCCFDDHGSMVELHRAGTTYQMGAGAAPRAVASADATSDSAGGVHALLTSPLTVSRILAIAELAAWPCGMVDTGLFKVVALWIESRQLLELTTEELVPDYQALYGRAGRVALDRRMREVETQLRRSLAGRRDGLHGTAL